MPVNAEYHVRRLEKAITSVAVTSHDLTRINNRIASLNYKVEQSRQEVESQLGQSHSIPTIDGHSTEPLLQSLKQLTSAERSLDRANQDLSRAERYYQDAEREYASAKETIIRKIERADGDPASRLEKALDTSGDQDFDNEPADTDTDW